MTWLTQIHVGDMEILTKRKMKLVVVVIVDAIEAVAGFVPRVMS
jgi:hypothetical protein